MPWKWSAILLAGLLASACAGLTTPAVRPMFDQGGGVFVYLRPTTLEHESAGLLIDDVFAVGADGSMTPLSPTSREFTRAELARERLLAVGDLPPGAYDGLALAIRPAPRGRPAEAAAPTAPVKIERPFQVVRRRAVVLAVDLQAARDEAAETAPFTLSAAIPEATTAGLVALTTAFEFNTATVFDKTTGAVTAVIPTGRGPSGIALDQTRRRAYVALTEEDAIEVIDLLQNVIVDRMPLQAGDGPAELALTPDGALLLAVNTGSSSVSVIDPRSLVEKERTAVGTGPQSLVLDAEGRRAYVLNTQSDSISILDVGSGSVLGTITVPESPARAAFNAAGSLLYVVGESSPDLTVVDPLARSIVRRIHIGAGGTTVKVDLRTDRIYVARRAANAVDVYDPASLLPVATIRTVGEASHLAIDSEGNNLYIVAPRAGRVQVVGLVSERIVAEVDVGPDPRRVVCMGER